jgi:hypothetical protein
MLNPAPAQDLDPARELDPAPVLDPAWELDPAPVLDALALHPTLRVFVHDGRVPALPARMAKRRVLLNEVALAFEPGIQYPEPQVDDFLRRIHPDHAALRRYMVDAEFLEREDGMYWRIGGSEV